MRILDRYILKSFWNTFITCLLIFIFLYVIIDLFSHLDEFLQQKVNVELLLRYYLEFLPIIFVQISPIACLLATIYTLSTLNRNNEIIAMRCAGMSILKIVHVLIIFALLISILIFVINEKFVSQSQERINKIKAKFQKKDTPIKQQGEVIKNLSIYGMGNRLFFVKKFSTQDNTMEGIIILKQDSQQNLISKTIAAKGVWQDNIWKFYQSQTFNFDTNGRVIGEPEYHEEEIMDIPESPQDFLTQRKLPEYMNIPQLENYIYKLSQSQAKAIVQSLKVDLYSRYAFPFTALIITLLGIPFSLKIRRRVVGLSSLGVSIILGFFYYLVNAVAIALGKQGVLPALAAAWIANFIFLGLSFYLISNLP